jgi:hypothetical protein
MVMSVASKDFLKSAICNLHLLFLVFFFGRGQSERGKNDQPKEEVVKQAKRKMIRKACAHSLTLSHL